MFPSSAIKQFWADSWFSFNRWLVASLEREMSIDFSFVCVCVHVFNWSTIDLQCCISFYSRAKWFSDQFSSVAQLCPTLCDPMDCSMPGLTVHHQLPILVKLLSIESMMPSNHLVLCHPLFLLPSIFPSIRAFPMSQLFISDGQSIGASVSASALPMYIQGWFPLGLTGLMPS